VLRSRFAKRSFVLGGYWPLSTPREPDWPFLDA
jgi:hypothetical protein